MKAWNIPWAVERTDWGEDQGFACSTSPGQEREPSQILTSSFLTSTNTSVIARSVAFQIQFNRKQEV
jgi:hypothetical protein